MEIHLQKISVKVTSETITGSCTKTASKDSSLDWEIFEITKPVISKKIIHVCRICAENKQKLSKIDKTDLKEKLMTHLGITLIRNDDLPKLICAECLNMLENFHEFVKMSKDSEKILLAGHVRTKKITVDIESPKKSGEKEAIETQKIESTEVPVETTLQFSDLEIDLDVQDGFDCKDCFFHCKTKSELKAHCDAAHLAYISSQNLDTLNNLSDVICDKCGYIAKNLTKLNIHLHYHHTVSDTPLKCKHVNCKKLKFSNKYKLKKHEQIHRRKKAECSDCGKTFGSGHQLKVHIKGVHKNIRDNICINCGKGFPDPYKLKIHFLSHSKKAEHECPECGCLFIYKHVMKQHLKREHKVCTDEEET